MHRVRASQRRQCKLITLKGRNPLRRLAISFRPFKSPRLAKSLVSEAIQDLANHTHCIIVSSAFSESSDSDLLLRCALSLRLPPRHSSPAGQPASPQLRVNPAGKGKRRCLIRSWRYISWSSVRQSDRFCSNVHDLETLPYKIRKPIQTLHLVSAVLSL